MTHILNTCRCITLSMLSGTPYPRHPSPPPVSVSMYHIEPGHILTGKQKGCSSAMGLQFFSAAFARA